MLWCSCPLSGCRSFATELKHKRFKLCGGAPNLGRQTCYPLSVLEGFVRSCLQKFGEKGAQSSPTFRKFNKIQKAQQNSHPAVQTGAVQPQIIYSGGHGGSRGQNSHLAVQTEVVLQWGQGGSRAQNSHLAVQSGVLQSQTIGFYNGGHGGSRGQESTPTLCSPRRTLVTLCRF